MAKAKIPGAPDAFPWKPSEWEPADATAFQALERGDCPPHLQQRALAWLIKATGAYDLSYRPGEHGDRDTAFAEGKRFVGLQIVKLLRVIPGRFTEEGKQGVPSEQG